MGLAVSLVMLITGHRPKRWGYCWYFEAGKKRWGGCEWGPVFIKDRYESEHIKNHEFGHGLQNCVFGPLMPFIVSAPSSIRYWTRRIQTKMGNPPEKDYDDIWFEGQATRAGTDKMRLIREKENKRSKERK